MQPTSILPSPQEIPPFQAKVADGPSSWTEERTAFFVRIYADTAGFTSSQIAEKVSKEFDDNISRNAVIGRAHRVRVFIDGVWKKLCEAYPRPSATRVAKKQDKPFTQPRNRARARKPRADAIYAPSQKRQRNHLLIPALPFLPEERITLAARQPNTCCFLAGDPRTPDYTYCGAPAVLGDYCEGHYDLMHEFVERRRAA